MATAVPRKPVKMTELLAAFATQLESNGRSDFANIVTDVSKGYRQGEISYQQAMQQLTDVVGRPALVAEVCRLSRLAGAEMSSSTPLSGHLVASPVQVESSINWGTSQANHGKTVTCAASVSNGTPSGSDTTSETVDPQAAHGSRVGVACATSVCNGTPIVVDTTSESAVDPLGPQDAHGSRVVVTGATSASNGTPNVVDTTNESCFVIDTLGTQPLHGPRVVVAHIPN